MRKVAKKKLLRAGSSRRVLAKSQPSSVCPEPLEGLRKSSRGIAGKELSSLLKDVRQLILSARQTIATAVNLLQVRTNFEIGRRIFQYEQKGAKRAEYGAQLLVDLSARLTQEFGKGFSTTNLKLMRKFYMEYQSRIGQKASDQSTIGVPVGEIGQKASDQLAARRETRQSTDAPVQNVQKPSAQSGVPFSLSWSHYVLLLSIKDEDERHFYEIEATSEGWSLPELKRQLSSSLYERLALSRKKGEVRKLAAQGQVVQSPADILKEPYVLEFLGLDEKASYSESDFEQAIINRIEHFLLELGKGFLFEARQKRFTFDEDHFFVDLVFYNRLLRCYVIIDLKIGKLTHQDVGQMQMYVNHYDRAVKLPDENPTIGILLCKHKKDAVVELTLPKDANIHAREYKLYLPTKQLLKQKLLDWSNEQERKA